MLVSINEPYTFNCDKAVSGRSVYTFMPEKTVVFTAEMVRKPFMYSTRLFLSSAVNWKYSAPTAPRSGPAPRGAGRQSAGRLCMRATSSSEYTCSRSAILKLSGPSHSRSPTSSSEFTHTWFMDLKQRPFNFVVAQLLIPRCRVILQIATPCFAKDHGCISGR